MEEFKRCQQIANDKNSEVNKDSEINKDDNGPLL